jgi:uncharacterized membrane protein
VQAQSPPPTRARIDSIDWLRGMVMIVMLLDHARDFLHSGGMSGDPLDPSSTTLALYLTRWVTHLCAPTFVFLAGLSAGLQLQRGMAKRELSRFLLTRGLFLVALELVVLRPLLFGDFDFARMVAFLQVIWALGCSMIVLAALVHAPRWFAACFGAALLLLHNLFDSIRFESPAHDLSGALWAVLHQPNQIQFGAHGPTAMVMYPLVPWIGVMALGFVAGSAFEFDAPRRRRVLGSIGALAIVFFFALRWSNLYGDPNPWRAPTGDGGESLAPWRTAFSFFNVEKYPPSLLYLAITLGIALVSLAVLDGRSFGRLSKPVLTFGRVPLFFYVLQWPALHLIGSTMRATHGPFSRENSGFELPGVYLGWAIGLIVLYPLCAAFAALKRRNKSAWLSYL